MLRIKCSRSLNTPPERGIVSQVIKIVKII